MMTEKFEELYSELNAMDSREIKNAIEEAIKKGCRNIIAPFEVRIIIEAQQAEIERLEQNLKEAHINIKKHQAHVRNLKIVIDKIEDHINPLPFETDYDKAIRQAKAEAVKELAERLQDKCNKQGGCLYASDIGAELNEMVGENNG